MGTRPPKRGNSDRQDAAVGGGRERGAKEGREPNAANERGGVPISQLGRKVVYVGVGACHVSCRERARQRGEVSCPVSEAKRQRSKGHGTRHRTEPEPYKKRGTRGGESHSAIRAEGGLG